MDAIHIDVQGERQAGIRFDEFPDALYEDLKTEIDALGIELFAGVEAATPMRSGELRAQERLRVFADPTRITAYVDVAGRKGSQDFAKAAALEYGAHRPSKVAAHTMALDHYWALKLTAPERVVVDAYTRTPNIAEHAFERGPLNAMAPEVIARLNAVVDKATAEANR
jgi:hypothetical protein